MTVEGLPQPWSTILSLVVGPVGAFVAMGLVIYFLWKLFREEQAENRSNFATVGVQAQSIDALSAEMKQWREAFLKLWADRGMKGEVPPWVES